MAHSARQFAVFAGAIFAFAALAQAQTAFRCDNNGQTTYSDKPCPPSHSSKAVVDTQDSAQQKAASKDANAQMRKDNDDLNKRLSEREKLEARERADARKAKGTNASGKGRAGANAKTRTVKVAKPAKSKSKAVEPKKPDSLTRSP